MDILSSQRHIFFKSKLNKKTAKEYKKKLINSVFRLMGNLKITRNDIFTGRFALA